MGWFGKLTFGSLGFFLGGPLGAVAGAALGHHLVDRNEGHGEGASFVSGQPRLDHAEQAQATYFISLFSILGKLPSLINGSMTLKLPPSSPITTNFLFSVCVFIRLCHVTLHPA